MKELELSIEEKAKRYDEVKNKLSRFIAQGVDPLITRADVQDFFPELKESEDERIRKGLIALIKECLIPPTLFRFGLNNEDTIAWLEKQGNLAISWNANTEENKPSVNHSVLMKTTHGIVEGEYKGDRWFQYRWSSPIKDSDVLSWIELSDLEKQQKPIAWSEEDETMITDLSVIVHTYFSEINGIPFKHDLSEDKIRTWLKFLKGRYAWKPSEEQMEALEKECIVHSNYATNCVDY